MSAQDLATTPLFMSSLVVCGLVAGYALSVLLRFALSSLSTTALTSGMDASQMLAIKTAGTFQKQLATLRSRIELALLISNYVPEPFADSSWQRLLDTHEALHRSEKDLTRLLRRGKFEDGLLLGGFLSGTQSPLPHLHELLDEEQIHSLTNWQHNSTLCLQRILTKVEDAVREGKSPSHSHVPPDLLNAIQNLRAGIAHDEKRYG
jgi:hypothetical protein